MAGGVGYIAHALSKEIENSIIFSYDIIEEATKYGIHNFKDVNFINKGIEINDVLKEGKFDVILANEFYPFTRNNDWEYQKMYIHTCLGNLNNNGLLVIGLTDIEDCLLDNYSKIINDFKEMNIRKEIIPYTKIMHLCRNNIPIAQILSKIFKGNNKLHYFIIIQK